MGVYRPIELTTAPDGILKGYSAVLGLSLCWDNNWPRLYDPATNSYLTNWRQERAARQAERAAYEAQAAVEQAERLAERGPPGRRKPCGQRAGRPEGAGSA